MNTIKVLFLFSAICLFIPKVNAQGLAVNAGMSENNKTVIVRWFSQEAFNIEGVNIYRRENASGDWRKLNPNPLKRMEKADTNTSDQKLILYNSLIYDMPGNPDDVESWHLMQITEGVADPEFSRAFGMEYDDNAVEAGKTYEYKVIRISNGNESEGQISNSVKIENYKPANSPESFAALDGGKIASFTWKTDKKKYFFYNIYRSDTPTGKKVKLNSIPVFVFTFKDETGKSKTSENYYTDTTAISGKTCYYSLEGIDFLGRASRQSGNIKVTPKSLIPVAAPINLKAKVDNNKVTISWQILKPAEVKGLNVFRGISFKGKHERVNKNDLHSTDTAFTEIINNPEPAYYYYIEAVGKDGSTSNSGYVLAAVPDMNPPSKPENLKGTGEVGTISLTWDLGKDKNLLGYYIYRSITSNPDELLLLTPFPVKTNYYTDTLKKENQSYFYYQIKAVSKKYITGVSSDIVKVIMKDVTPPLVPVITNAWYEKGMAVIEWQGNMEEDFAGYEIYRSSSLQNEMKKLTYNKLLQAGKTRFIDSLKEPGTYSYAITAKDTNGNESAKSKPVSILVLSADTTLAGVEGVKAEYNKKQKSVAISWNKVDKNNLSGYMVFRYADGISEVISNLIKDSLFIDKSPNSGKNVYTIKAYDNSGNMSISKEVEVDITE